MEQNTKIKVLGTGITSLQSLRLLHLYVESNKQCNPRTLAMQCIDENNITLPVFVNTERVYSLKRILGGLEKDLQNISQDFMVFYNHRINSNARKDDILLSSKETIVKELEKAILTVDKNKYPDISYLISKIIDIERGN